jgi:hypothetical protein
MTSQKEADARGADVVDETTPASLEGSEDRTEVGLGDGGNAIADSAAGGRPWSKDDIAKLARHFEGDSDEETAGAAADPIARRLIANLGRRSNPPSGPIPERACSEGGDYVVYSGAAGPVPARNESSVAPRVVVTGSDATTALLPRRRRTWLGGVLTLGAPAAWMALGAALGILGSRWARTEAAPVSSAPERSLSPTASAAVEVGPPPLSASRAARLEGSASASVEHPAASPKANGHRAAATAPMPPTAKRPVEAAARKSNLHDDADDGMEATGY